MNIGEKIQKLKESMNFKDYQEFGKAVGLPGDWIKDALSKKESITTVDITRLIKIAEYFNVTLDWLLKDNNEWVIKYKEGFKEGLTSDDIGIMLDEIDNKLCETNNKFYGYNMNKDTIILCKDALDEVKKLIKDNL